MAYLKMAKEWGELSHCQRKKVGAIIVKNNMIISDGFNGTPSGFDNNCEDSDGNTNWYVLHAEANAILKVAKINKNSKVLILGMGGLGYSSLLVLNYLRCQDIVAVDSNIRRLKLIKNKKNVKFIHLGNKDELNIFIKKNHEKFDLIIDCTGSKKLIQKTFVLCKKFGGQFIIIGNTKIDEKITLNSWDIISGKTLTGAWGQGGTVMKNFKINKNILIDQIDNIKKILPKKNYKLSKINKAIDDFKRGIVLRPIIKF